MIIPDGAAASGGDEDEADDTSAPRTPAADGYAAVAARAVAVVVVPRQPGVAASRTRGSPSSRTSCRGCWPIRFFLFFFQGLV